MQFIQEAETSIINIDLTSIFIENVKKIDLEKFFEKITNTELTSISLRKCSITEIPRDLFKKFTKLESIDLYANSIEDLNFFIPDTVTALNISYNRVKYITIHESRYYDKLEFVDLSYNFLDRYPPPEFFGNAKIKIDHNDFDEIKHIVKGLPWGKPGKPGPLINPANPTNPTNPVRPVNPINNATAGPNVHETQIQNATLKFIEKLLNKELKRDFDYINKLVKAFEKKEKLNWFTKYFSYRYHDFKYLLNVYNNDNRPIVYNYDRYQSCKMSHIIEKLYLVYVSGGENCDNFIENLYQQMKDGIGYCFVGKYTRLVNVVDGTAGVQLSVNDQISNKIVQLRKNGHSVEDIKKEITGLMTRFGLSRDDQRPWLDALDDE